MLICDWCGSREDVNEIRVTVSAQGRRQEKPEERSSLADELCRACAYELRQAVRLKQFELGFKKREAMLAKAPCGLRGQGDTMTADDYLSRFGDATQEDLEAVKREMAECDYRKQRLAALSEILSWAIRQRESAPAGPAHTAFGRILAARREKLGLSQDAIAVIVGVSRNTVGNWEAGRTGPSLQMLSKLALALDTSANQLVTEAVNDAKEEA